MSKPRGMKLTFGVPKTGSVSSFGGSNKIILGQPISSAKSTSTSSMFSFNSNDDSSDSEDSDSEDSFSKPNKAAGLASSSIPKNISMMNEKIMTLHQAKSKVNTSVDDSVFAYDEVYDEIQSKRQKSSHNFASISQKSSDPAQPSGLMKNLLDRAELRKKEREMMRERVLLREQLREEQEIGPVERFVTSAYRKKLQETKQWEEKLAAQDAADTKSASRTLTQKSTEFYASLASRITTSDTKPSINTPTPAGRNEDEYVASLYNSTLSIPLQTSSKYLLDSNQPTSDTSTSMIQPKESAASGTTISELDELLESGVVSFEAPILSDDRTAREKRASSAKERALARLRAKQQYNQP